MNDKPPCPAVTHVERQAERDYTIRRRAPRWIATGLSMLALAIVLFTIGGGEWLKICAPVCWGGVLMISVGSWTMFPSKRSRIINAIMVTLITVAIFVGIPSAT